MKPSRFNVSVPSLSHHGRFFCYNTLSNTAAILPKALESYPVNSSSLRNLIKLGFFILDEVNEDSLVGYWLHKKQMATDVLRIEIMPTLQCNFTCEYCVAEPIKANKFMNHRTTKQVINWIKKKISETRPKRLYLQFSGGEPLLNKKEIYFICRNLKNFCKKRGLVFEFGVFSNGSLTMEMVVKKLSKLGLTTLQTTLDGLPPIHDRRRYFISGRGSFETIFKNLQEIEDLPPKLLLRCNIDFQNYRAVPKLLRFLKKNLNAKNITIQFARVVDINRRPSEAYKQRRIREFDTESAQRILSLYKLALKMGFKVGINKDNAFAPYGMCMFASANSFAIDPGGNIYKCVGSIGDNRFTIGNIFEGENYLKEISQTMTAFEFRNKEKCRDCNFLPICMGGCRNLALLDTGDFFKPICHKSFFENISMRLLELLYEQGLTKRG